MAISMVRLLLVAALVGACTTASPSTSQATPPSTAASDPIGTVSPTTAAATPTAPVATRFEAVLVAPKCSAPAALTTASTEGPYFKAGSPEKASLVTAGMAGTRIQLLGFVMTRSCAPVARAKVDIWQANANGEYDNAGYTLRGHVFTDAQGKYSIETIVPGRYPGRTPHIHVKVEPPGGPVLTTQLYMPNEAGNASDGIFRADLVMTIIPSPHTGGFTFVVDKP